MKKILILLLLGFIQFLTAQINTSLQVFGHYNDNLFRAPQAESDFLSELELNLSYAPNSSLRFYASPSYVSYQSNYLRNFTLLSGGLTYNQSFGKEQRHTLYLGMDTNWRLNKDDYNYYDYSQFFAYASVNLKLNWFYLRSGYNYRYRNYNNFSELSNNRHFLFAQINKSFPTRTSLIIEGDLGYKSFAGQTSFFSSSGSGRGNGRRASMTGSGLTSSETIPSLAQAIILARIAQSLHSRVGLFVQYRQQFALESGSTYSNENEYFQDEELFDDPFSYESTGFSSGLTWMMPFQMQLKAGASLISKAYISEAAFADAADTLGTNGVRSDEQQSVYLTLSKKFFLRKKFADNVKLNFNYGFINNHSNSYWYDYRNNYFSLGLQWNLK